MSDSNFTTAFAPWPWCARLVWSETLADCARPFFSTPTGGAVDWFAFAPKMQPSEVCELAEPRSDGSLK